MVANRVELEAYEQPTRPDVYIPIAVLAAIPRGWASSLGTIYVRYGLRALGMAA